MYRCLPFFKQRNIDGYKKYFQKHEVNSEQELKVSVNY